MMMKMSKNFVYTLPWILWIGWFLFWEALGFRRAYDRWPTFSELTKGWMDTDWGERVPNIFSPAQWGWRRWLVAIGLPVSAVVLELHWVLEIF